MADEAVLRTEAHKDDDDDEPRLSAYALAALHEFLAEQSGQNEDENALELPLLSEDWRLSQFWYDSSTAQVVADELSHLSFLTASPVACVSCPTLYAQLKKSNPEVEAQIFEFDKRFEKYGTDFTFYDYNQPEDLPIEYHHSFHVVVADPPYLSEECLMKVAKTMMFLANSMDAFILLLTGEVQKELAEKHLNLHPCGFRPTHNNKLGNTFMLFTNYDPMERLGGWGKST